MSGHFVRLLVRVSASLVAAAVLQGSLAAAAERKAFRPLSKGAAAAPMSDTGLPFGRNRHPQAQARLPDADAAKFILDRRTVNDPSADRTAQDSQLDAAIADLGGGRLVAAFTDSGIVSNDELHGTGYAYSADNGVTWTDVGSLPDSQEGDGGAPDLAVDQRSGDVFLATVGFRTGENIQVFKSADGGKTFRPPVNGTPGYAGSDEFQDWPSIAVDNFDGLPQGNIYLCWTNFSLSGRPEVRLTRSVTGGATFGPAYPQSPVIASGGRGCFVAVSPNHQVNVFYFRGTDGGAGSGIDNKLFVRRSVNKGVTFGPEIEIADLSTVSIRGDLGLNGGFTSNSFPQAAVNPVPTRRFIYVIFNDDPSPADGADNGDIYVVASIDGGATWREPIRANDDQAGDQFFPSIAFTEDGERLLVTYYSRSQDPDNAQFHRRARIGVLDRKGAIAFGPSFQVAPNAPVVIDQDPAFSPGSRSWGRGTRASAGTGRF